MPMLATQPGVLIPTEAPNTPVAKARGRRSRGRIAFWFFFSIVAVFAMVAGVLTWQIIDTVGTVNSLSTPPPSFSAGLLGGSPDATIDTGPAKTAVAARALGLTATPTPTNTAVPTSTATTVPTNTATATPEPTATSTATTAPTATATATELDENDLPWTIDVPVDNLTATLPPASPVATEPAVSEQDEDYGLPTAISDAVNNLTPTPPTSGAEVAVVETATVAPKPVSTPSPRPTSTPVATTVPNVTAPETPTAAATATLEPTAVPTVLSEIERVKNGSFEQDVEGWYVESGAGAVPVADAPDGAAMLQLPATGGYADQVLFTIPGTSYYLSASGRLSAEGDTGVIGVVYRDANGTRLTDLEPKPISFSGTKLRTKGLEFTPPEQVAKVSVYIYKDDGPAALEVDAISIRSIVPPVAASDAPGGGPALAAGSQTILIMGVDARPGEAIDGQVRPDSLMVVHLNPTSSSCRVLSIPRDTRTELPGYGLTKINHALALGGISYEVQVVSDLIDLPIDHYVLIDFTGFEDLVDAVGGITIDVPEGFTAADGIVFPTGPQQMTGKQALSYSRHRGDAVGDFGRIKRQQEVIRALIKQTSGLEVLASIREFLPAVQNNLRTDLSVSQMIDLASTYRSICTEDAVTMMRLEGEIATFDDPILNMPLSYVVVDEAEIRRKVAALIEP
jgi:LCP family protein required for cell wall assembly